jgi:hypothetical protein
MPIKNFFSIIFFTLLSLVLITELVAGGRTEEYKPADALTDEIIPDEIVKVKDSTFKSENGELIHFSKFSLLPRGDLTRQLVLLHYGSFAAATNVPPKTLLPVLAPLKPRGFRFGGITRGLGGIIPIIGSSANKISVFQGLTPGDENDSIEEVGLGQFAYKIPALMDVDSSYPVIAYLTRSTSRAVLFENADSAGFTDTLIPLARLTTVTLQEESTTPNFSIKNNDTLTQGVSKNFNTKWSWTVKPLNGGILALVLRVTLRLKINGTDAPRDLKVYEQKITVHASFFHSVKDFSIAHWDWIFSVLLIPSFKQIYDDFVKKRKTRNDDNNVYG